MHVDHNAELATPPTALDTALINYILTATALKTRPSPLWTNQPEAEEKILLAILLAPIHEGEAVPLSLNFDESRCLYWLAALGAVLSLSGCEITGKETTADTAAPTLRGLERQLDLMHDNITASLLKFSSGAPTGCGMALLEDEKALETPPGLLWTLHALMHVLPEHRDNKTAGIAYYVEPAEVGGAKQAKREVREAINTAARDLIRMSLHTDGLALILHQSLKLPSIDTGFIAALVSAVCDASSRTAAALVNLTHAIETARKNTANGKRGARSIEDELAVLGITRDEFAEECLETYNVIHLRDMRSDTDAYIEAAKELKRKYTLPRFSASSCSNYCTIGRKNREDKQNKNP